MRATVYPHHNLVIFNHISVYPHFLQFTNVIQSKDDKDENHTKKKEQADDKLTLTMVSSQLFSLIMFTSVIVSPDDIQHFQ